MRILLLCGTIAAFSLATLPANAQDGEQSRALLELAAQSMGGLDRLQDIENFTLTGFGQRYVSNGSLAAHPEAPTKWQSVADARRSFDLANGRALLEERRNYMFPFALQRGHDLTRTRSLQTGRSVLDHPLPALLAALDPDTTLGSVHYEDGMPVIPFTTERGELLWIALDPEDHHLPAWVRWISGDAMLGDVTNTFWFTGYLPFEGVYLPIGLTQRIDWRDQIVFSFQVDSYRIDVADLPQFPDAPSAPFVHSAGELIVDEVSPGVWDVRFPDGNVLPELEATGGAVIEFEDYLVMMEPYASEGQTLDRIDAANALVPGKEVEYMIVSHHHSDHAAGLRAAVSRGITIIGHRRNEDLYRELVARPAVYYPDALAENPQPLRFLPVDDVLVLEDAMQRLEIYHVVGHLHMSDAVFAYLPEERIIMHADFADENYQWNWWPGALLDNVEHYGLDPELSIPVHGTRDTFAAKVARVMEQAQAAQDFCDTLEASGIYQFGCPVQFTRESYSWEE